VVVKELVNRGILATAALALLASQLGTVVWGN
jgi:hypothetical protein